MILESDVRQHLIEFLGGRLPLQEFEDWLVSNSWNMHQDSAPDAQDLVSAVELALSEYSNGHRSFSELRDELANLLDNIVISVVITVQRVQSVNAPRFGSNAFQVPPPFFAG